MHVLRRRSSTVLLRVLELYRCLDATVFACTESDQFAHLTVQRLRHYDVILLVCPQYLVQQGQHVKCLTASINLHKESVRSSAVVPCCSAP